MKQARASDPTATQNKGDGNSETVDTIYWTTRPDAKSPIKNKPKPTPPPKPAVEVVVTEPEPNENVDPFEPKGNQVYDSYNIAYLLPFLTERMEGNRISGTSETTLHFYSGAKLALYHLEEEGKKFNVSVVDSKEGIGPDIKGVLSKPSLENAHLIIGLRTKAALTETADFVKKQHKVLVSPWNPSDDIVDDNPYYVQVSPSLATHCSNILKNARERFGSDHIRLVARSSEVSRMKYFQEANILQEGSTSAPRLTELVVPEDRDTDYGQYVLPTDTTVFIIPSWNETFVASTLRQIAMSCKGKAVVVYGMPQWQDFTKVGLDYYDRLNVHLSNSFYIDRASPKIVSFIRDFYQVYGTLPLDDAYLGYDVTLYFGRMLSKHGAYFQNKLDVEPAGRLHTRFKFENIYPAGDDSFSKIKEVENKYVNILRFGPKGFYRIN